MAETLPQAHGRVHTRFQGLQFSEMSNMSTDQEQLLLRVPEAAARLGVGRSTIYVLLGRKELPVIRIGAAVRIPRAALDAWVQRQIDEAD